jgi:hypothetical protein
VRDIEPIIVYVANPYTHADRAVLQHRVDMVRYYTATLLARGVVAYSPIVHGHDLHANSGVPLPTDWESWREFDLPFIHAAKELHVLALPGWRESRGVREEAAEAMRLNIPRHYLAPVGVDPLQRGPLLPQETSTAFVPLLVNEVEWLRGGAQ